MIKFSRRVFLHAMAAAGVGYLSAPAKAITRLGYLDVSAAGIVPGSGKDASAAFEKLAWHASLAGQSLFLPSGEYLVSGVRLPPALTIIGVKGNTRLITGRNAPIFSGNGTRNLVLENLELQGTGEIPDTDGYALLDLVRCEQVTIRNCHFSRGSQTAISLYASGGTILDCDFSDIADAAIKSVDATGLFICRNRIGHCGNNGILVWRDKPGHDGTIVTQNYIQNIDWRRGGNGPYGNGINVFRAGGVLVSNNIISDCAFSAIRVNASRNCQILGNNCRNLSEVAIFSEFEFSGSIIAQNVIDGAAQGISITNWRDGGHLAVCAQNIVRNIWPVGRSNNPDTLPNAIAVEADTAVDGNVVENVPGIAISAGWGPYLRNVTITDNIVRQAEYGIYVSVARGAGAAQVTDNLMHDIGKAALVGGEWHNLVDLDLQKNSDSYPQLNVIGNLVAER